MKTLLTSFIFLILMVAQTHASGIKKASRDQWTVNDIDSLAEKVELIPIMINGDKDNRINIVLMNRWNANEQEPYNSEEMRAEFIKDINESIIAALTPGDPRAQTAYANYREFFNIYGLWYPESPEWGKGIDGDVVDALRDKLFLPWKDENLGWATFLVLPNSDNGGGGAGRNLEARVGRALIAGNGIAKMLHEIAHTCMSIGDEYTGPATGTSANPTYTMSTEYERDKINWKKWIDADTPLPTPYTEEYKDKVGAFEGGQYHLTGYYRSTAQGCIMGAGVFDNTERMCPICEQRVAMRVYKLVNPINSFTPSKAALSISGKTKLHFAIDHIKPNPNTQVVRWILNGQTIATGVDEVDVEFGELADYNLTCTLTDETPLIRPDPPFAEFPTREVRWTISNSAPTSAAKNLTVTLQTTQDKAKSGITLTPSISGGAAPFTYLWSDGSTNQTMKCTEAGIYELTVMDSEFRTAKAQHSVYASSLEESASAKNSKKLKQTSKDLALAIEITASEKDRNNGKLSVTATGGTQPYSYRWEDGKYEYAEGRIYEAEDAHIEIPGDPKKEYFDASHNQFIQFNEKEGSINWTVEVAKSGPYPIDIVYAGVDRKGTPMDVSVNGKSVNNALMFYPTRPLFTGWEKATVTADFVEGKNTIRLSSVGKSGANIDYLRLPASFTATHCTENKRFDLKPGDYSVVVTDQKHNSIKKTLTIPEVYPFEIPDLEIIQTRPGVLSIANPLPGYTYKWYAEDAPLFTIEEFEEPLFTGIEFKPAAPGNYYVSAKNNLSITESSNRICFAVGRAPESAKIKEMDPSSLGERSIKLWFDASDLDGDGHQDAVIPERGPVKDWKEKTWRDPGTIFAKYLPNKLNGMGVCSFDNVWVSDLGKKVSDVQTIILVYKESTLSFPGKSVFRDLNKYLGKSAHPEKSIFDRATIDEKTQKAKVFLNGQEIDPFNTPTPTDFCILTIEFNSPIKDSFSRVEGFWEGEIAEMIFVDRALTEKEHKGIEEHLRKKWFAAVDIQF